MGIKCATIKPRPAVLVIDDNDHLLTALYALLNSYYDVHCCREPEQGGAMVEEFRPDAVVLDIHMPRHDGF